ncbi:MAG TPA: hypothetical protein VIG62_19455 [Blastocatellia bacterium]|jgi:hypothetical protein
MKGLKRQARSFRSVVQVMTAIMLLSSGSLIANRSATAAPVFQTEVTIPIPEIVCVTQGQECQPVFTTLVQTTNQLEIQFTPDPGHCSSVAVRISVDGGPAQTTAFLGPGQPSPFLNFGPVTPGTHTISVQGIGTVGGCNEGRLFGWLGSLRVRGIDTSAGPFDKCIQDDTKPGLIFQFNMTTGQYFFTNCVNFTMSGTGRVTMKGSTIHLVDTRTDRRVSATIDTPSRRGTASVQRVPSGPTFTVTDRNVTNNPCLCPGGAASN